MILVFGCTNFLITVTQYGFSSPGPIISSNYRDSFYIAEKNFLLLLRLGSDPSSDTVAAVAGSSSNKLSL